MYFNNPLAVDAELALQMQIKPDLVKVYREQMGEEPVGFVKLPLPKLLRCGQ